MKLNEISKPSPKSKPWKFSAEELKAIDAEIEAKFRSIWGIKGAKMEIPKDFDEFSDEGEELKRIFWHEIVEPGWNPELIASRMKEAEKSDNEDRVFDVQEDAQYRVAKKLGIPEELIEL